MSERKRKIYIIRDLAIPMVNNSNNNNINYTFAKFIGYFIYNNKVFKKTFSN